MPLGPAGYALATMTSTTDPHCTELREALRSAASALKEHGPPFALAGSYALWAYGAPEPTHDVDFVVTESDVSAAATVLGKAGFTIERPPEDWLFKAHIGETVVDVLHRVNGQVVEPATLEVAEERVVLAVRMPVLPPTTVFIQKLRALTEHYCDFTKLIPAARAIREQLDWDRIEEDTADNDFAAAFLVLASRLGLRE